MQRGLGFIPSPWLVWRMNNLIMNKVLRDTIDYERKAKEEGRRERRMIDTNKLIDIILIVMIFLMTIGIFVCVKLGVWQWIKITLHFVL